MAGHHHESGTGESGEHHGNHPRGYAAGAGPALPGGLTVASDGLRLEASDTRLDPGVERAWEFRIRDDAGSVVTDFEETHDRLAHRILVRRDLTRFRHLHPEMDREGTWTAEFALPDPGAYRAFVDVLVDGRPTTLGVDLLASGSAAYEGQPGSALATAVDGYNVRLSAEAVEPGEDAVLEFEVRRDGDPVALEPHLGALGHLVALRDGDLAYLHVHPDETDRRAGRVRFRGNFPSVGRYRLFLQARPEGELVTATFDLPAGDL